MVMFRRRLGHRMMVASMVMMTSERRRRDGAVMGVMVMIMSSGRRRFGDFHDVMMVVVVVNRRGGADLGTKHRRRQRESGHKGDLHGVSHHPTPFKAIHITHARLAPADASTPWARGRASPH